MYIGAALLGLFGGPFGLFVVVVLFFLYRYYIVNGRRFPWEGLRGPRGAAPPPAPIGAMGGRLPLTRPNPSARFGSSGIRSLHDPSS